MARLVRVGSRRGVVAVRPPRTRRSVTSGASARASTTPRTGAATRSVLLYYPPGAPPNVLAGGSPPAGTSAAPDASFGRRPRDPTHPPRARHPPRPRALHEDLGAGTSGVQRWFGLGCPFAVVEPPFSFGSRFSDVDEASAIRSAVSDGFESAGAPRTGQSSRPCTAPRGARSSAARTAMGGPFASRRIRWTARRRIARAGTLAGLAETTRERLAATGAVASWNPADDAHADDAHASARLTFPTDRRWIVGRRASGSGFGSESGSESDEGGGAGAAFMALADGGPTVARRRRARASDANASVNAAGGGSNPRRVGRRTRRGRRGSASRTRGTRSSSTRVGATRLCVDCSAAATARTRYHRHTRRNGSYAPSRPARRANRATSVGVGVGASLANEKTEVKTEAEHGVESSDGRLGLAEMYYKLSAAASSRATLDAETMGRLASEEFWDDTAGPARGRPRGGRARRSPGRLRHERWRGERAPRRVRTRRDGARAPVSNPPRSARLPRVSSRASRCTRYVSETCARCGVMATVRARDSIRALGPRRVVTARGCGGIM